MSPAAKISSYLPQVLSTLNKNSKQMKDSYFADVLKGLSKIGVFYCNAYSNFFISTTTYLQNVFLSETKNLILNEANCLYLLV